MSQISPGEPAATLPLEDVERWVQRVADSNTFRSAPVMRTLLLYLWQHRGESVSEYAVAIDALNRPAGFDPKSDATVRVQIARLRAKLKEFYEREAPEGVALNLRVPLGAHALEWAYEPTESPAATLDPLPRLLPVGFRRLAWCAAIVIVALTGACGVLLVKYETLRASSPASPPPLPHIWRSFLVEGKKPMIVVSNPLFFRWRSHSNILMRDVNISEFQDWQSSPFLKELGEKWGTPTLNQIYAPVGQMKTALKLWQFLDTQGLRPELTDSPNLAADAIGAQNTIFLGIPRYYPTNHRVTQILGRMNFRVTGYEPAVIENNKPFPGEANQYREVEYSNEHRLFPQLMILLPPAPNGGRTLLLMGPISMAFSSMLLSPEGINLLDKKWKESGSPDSWELLIQAEVNGDTVLRIVPVAMREIPKKFWN